MDLKVLHTTTAWRVAERGAGAGRRPEACDSPSDCFSSAPQADVQIAPGEGGVHGGVTQGKYWGRAGCTCAAWVYCLLVSSMAEDTCSARGEAPPKSK
uniref:Uncharacterized protein n=1 Tax=Knipowitschia caucasica TaxID=637954 RepID=A0AAV2KS71_KNICA